MTLAPNQVRHTEKKGRHIIAGRDYREREIIEVCEVIPLTESEAMRCTGTILERYFYYFTGLYYIALGNGSLYNHSDDNNAEPLFTADTIHIFAIKPIAKGQEITICYESLKYNNNFTG